MELARLAKEAGASRPRAPRLLSYSSSFTNGCADPSPTVASTINPTPSTGLTAVLRRPIIVPTPQSRKSSICSPPLNAAASSVGVVLSNNLRARIYPYLLRGVEITRPNQVWAMDITYIAMAKGFVYLAVVLDWFSRRVLSWRVSITMEASFCVAALEEALTKHVKPEIVNTDQGAQFSGATFSDVLTRNGIKISMDGKGAWSKLFTTGSLLFLGADLLRVQVLLPFLIVVEYPHVARSMFPIQLRWAACDLGSMLDTAQNSDDHTDPSFTSAST
jgi:Integrase core domain